MSNHVNQGHQAHENARRTHQQMANQQRDSWQRMNEQWDRQAAVAAGAGGDLGPSSSADRIGLVVGALLVLLVVGGAVFAWVRLGDGGSGTESVASSGPPPEPQHGGGGSAGGGSGGREKPAAEKVAVPRVVDLSRRQATDALEADGFAVETAYAGEFGFCASDWSSLVVEQRPAAGTEVAPGSRVQLFLGLRDGDDHVVVPALDGWTVQSVREVFGADPLGLKVVVQQAGEEVDDDGSSVVESTSPLPCGRVEDGVLTLHVAPSGDGEAE